MMQNITYDLQINMYILYHSCSIAEKSSGHIFILMEARLCELYKSAAEYEIAERSVMFKVYLSLLRIVS